MNRRRSKGKSNFPRNLYENDGYYSWRNPLTGEYFGVGRDRAQAFEQALEANLKIAKLTQRPRLVDRIGGADLRTVAAWEEKYQKILDKHELTDDTRSNYRTFSRRMVKILGAERALKSVTALEVSEGLETIVAEGFAGVAKAVRAYMKLSFAEAIVQGWRSIGDNPVIDTRLAAPPAVVRARLSLEVFMQVYERERYPWARNAYALALTSAQRREDVALAVFADFRDQAWWCTQESEKTDHPHRIVIPYELKPAGFHLSLGDVVAQCRKTGVLSRYLVHQTKTRGRSSVGSPIGLETVTKAFTANVDALGIDWGEKTPPTFHEIRSLSERLYEPQGVNTQVLLGHSKASTTALYHNSRGLDWLRVTTV